VTMDMIEQRSEPKIEIFLQKYAKKVKVKN
jgi:hypothetical protein